MRTRAIIPGLLLLSGLAQAIELGQLDDFENGDRDGWTYGKEGTAQEPAVPPMRLEPDCGDEGTGDHCLRISANNSTEAPGSRLAAFNRTQWSGDYLAAGVGAIAIRAANVSNTNVTLQLRVRISGNGRSYITKDTIAVPRNVGYVDGVIRLSPASFIVSPSEENPTRLFEPVADALRNVDRIWIAHNPEGSIAPPPVLAVAHIDDIMALDDAVFSADFESP